MNKKRVKKYRILGGKMKKLRIIFLIVTIALAGMTIINKNFNFTPYTASAAGVTILLTGIIEIQQDKKAFSGYLLVLLSVFIFFASILEFLLN